jgi:hypothetical protein
MPTATDTTTTLARWRPGSPTGHGGVRRLELLAPEGTIAIRSVGANSVTVEADPR